MIGGLGFGFFTWQPAPVPQLAQAPPHTRHTNTLLPGNAAAKWALPPRIPAVHASVHWSVTVGTLINSLSELSFWHALSSAAQAARSGELEALRIAMCRLTELGVALDGLSNGDKLCESPLDELVVEEPRNRGPHEEPSRCGALMGLGAAGRAPKSCLAPNSKITLK